MRGRGERAHIGTGTRCKIDAAGIAQKYLPVGIQFPEDLARVAVQHAVERSAAAVWLVEVDRGRTADIESLPVYRGSTAGLVDVQCRASFIPLFTLYGK